MTKAIYIFTGAGLSAESGIRTFRDSDGLWEEYDINVVCNYETWRENYALVHKFYNERRVALKGVKPNPAHHFIADLWEQYGRQCKVFTTNVDNLLLRAGCYDVVHLHGKLTEMENKADGNVWHIGYNAYTDNDPDVKPNVVFFGECAPEYEHLHNLSYYMPDNALVIFIGMSYQVIPAWFCCPGSKKLTTVNVNPDPETNGEFPFTYCLNTTATEAIEPLRDLINNYMKE